jgi:tetratricopeptide (TPR) repeat protein
MSAIIRNGPRLEDLSAKRFDDQSLQRLRHLTWKNPRQAAAQIVCILMRRDRARFRWIYTLLFAAMLTAPAQLFTQDVTSARLRNAAHLLTAGNLKGAESELQPVLRVTPDEYRALDLLGVIRILQGRENDAQDLFHRVVAIKPDFASGHAHLGLLYVQMDRPGEAVPQLREAVRLDPARTDASVALVHIWRQQAEAATTAGDFATALALLTDARKLAPKNADVQLEFGTAALRMFLWQDAIEAFQQTLRRRKNDPVAIWGLGRAFTGLSKFEDARQQFARYVAMRPDDSSGHCALGMTLAALERSREARTQFEHSIKLAPAQTESYFRLGLLDLDSKDLDSAATNFRHALEHDPKHAGAMAGLGRIEFEQKRYNEALELLQKAIANDDSLRVAHYYLGLTYSRMDRKAESEQELEKATQLEHQEVEKRFTILDPGSASAPDAEPQKLHPNIRR